MATGTDTADAMLERAERNIALHRYWDARSDLYAALTVSQARRVRVLQAIEALNKLQRESKSFYQAGSS